MKRAQHNLPELLRNSDPRGLSRLLTLIDNNNVDAAVLDSIYSPAYSCHVLGVTGAPGAGKSTFIAGLVSGLVAKSARVGCILIDPSSPFSGGSLLGDRIRLMERGIDDKTFIRSVSSRGIGGGLSLTAARMTLAMAMFGLDYVIVETVGAGQTDHDIHFLADTVVLLLNPSGGDHVQAIKAGILEIADIFIVNKADLPGADRTHADITEMLHTYFSNRKWQPPVVNTISTQSSGFESVIEQIDAHHKHLSNTDEGRAKRKQRHLFAYDSFIQQQAYNATKLAHTQDKALQQLRNQVETLEADPVAAGIRAFELIEKQGKNV